MWTSNAEMRLDSMSVNFEYNTGRGTYISGIVHEKTAGILSMSNRFTLNISDNI